MNLRKYLVLLGIVVFGATGDALLSRGMKSLGAVPLDNLQKVILAVLHPSVAIGVLLLIAFFAAYMNALSWADLTYVLPATSIGYVLLAFIAKFLLHEHVTATRWVGISLIAAGVGFVAGGPARTHTSQIEQEAAAVPQCES